MGFYDVVGELVCEDDPPPDGGVGAAVATTAAATASGAGGGGGEVVRVKLEEEAEVAEEAAAAIEGDGASGLVIEDMQGRGLDGVDLSDGTQYARERVDRPVLRRQELARVRAVRPRDEDPRSVRGLRHEVQVVARVLVAVLRLLLDVLRRRRREQLRRVVRPR